MCGGGGDSSTTVAPTAQEMESSKESAELWNYYVQDYQPLVKKWSDLVSDPSVKTEEAANVAGQINASTMEKVDPSKVTANPVKNAAQLADLAGAGTKAQVTGQGKVKARQVGEQQNVIDIGRGQATTALAGESALAAESVKTAISEKEISQQEMGAQENAYGSMAGMIAAGALAPYKKPGTPGMDDNPYEGAFQMPSFNPQR